MKQIILKLLRKLSYICLQLLLKRYIKIADENKDGKLSSNEVINHAKQSIKDIQNFLSKYN
ncbi:MAG: hypothetical protein ACQESN_08815, partial [Thermotogota bacterium]